MQYHEISRGTVSKMVPTGTPAYFYKSPHGATITFMGLKEKIAEGRREANCAALGELWQEPLAQKNKETLQEQSTSEPADLASDFCFFTFWLCDPEQATQTL